MSIALQQEVKRLAAKVAELEARLGNVDMRRSIGTTVPAVKIIEMEELDPEIMVMTERVKRGPGRLRKDAQ